MTQEQHKVRDLEGEILPRLESFGCRAPRKASDLANPVVACYAAHLSKDWFAIYISALLATQNILGKPLFQIPDADLHNMGEMWVATPLRAKGKQAKGYKILSEVLQASVTWLKERDEFLLKEIRSYVALYDRVALKRPDSIENVRRQEAGERNWTIYRWENPFVAVARLAGFNPMAKEISVRNFPADLQPLGAGKEPLIGLLKVPGGVFPRYQIWHRAVQHTGADEDPWFALNFLGSTLDKSKSTRRKVDQFRHLAGQVLKDEDITAWWEHIARKFADLDLGLFLVEQDAAVEKEDLAAYVAHLFSWVIRRGKKT